jgi:hypothetical protein
MNELDYTKSVYIGNGWGHGFPEGSIPAAWAFLSTRMLP